MPSMVIKAKPDEDWYVYWSTVVDAPLVWGTAAEILRYPTREVTVDRIARADENGTSMRESEYDRKAGRGPEYGWDDKTLHCMEVQPCTPGTLQRADLRKFCELLGADPVDVVAAQALLTPFED